MWKLGDLGYEQFEELLLSQPSPKILPFLSHFTDQEIQRTSFRDTCAEVLDIGYVDSHVLPEIRFYLPQMERLIERLERENEYNARKHLDDMQKHQAQKQQHTQIVPFNLSSARVSTTRKNAYSEIPVRTFHARPIPEDILTPGGLTAIEQERATRLEEAREQVKAKYEGEEGFNLRTDIVAVNEAKRREREAAAKAKEEEEQRQKALEEERKRVKMVTQAKLNPEVIKLTSAAILRENALYQRLQARKVEEMMRYIGDMMDDYEYERWRQQMLSLDEEERRKRVEERRLQLIASSETKLAQARERLEKLQGEAQLQKLELKRQEAARAKDREEDRERKREMKIKVEGDKANIELKIAEMKEQKSQQADLLRRQMAKDREMIAEERELELAMRRELIAQIQELTRLAALKAQEPKVIDVNSSSGIGSLTEMSLYQLRVRLEEVKQEMEEEEKQRRQNIVEEKAKREAMLDVILRQNDRARNQRREYGDYVRSQRVKWRDVEGKAAKEQELADRVDEFEAKKREERRALALMVAKKKKEEDEEALVREKREQITAERRRKDAEMAMEKRVAREKEAAAQAAEELQEVRDMMRANRLATLKREQRSRSAGIQKMNDELRSLNQAASERQEMDMQRKIAIVNEIKESKLGVAPTEPMTLSLGIRNFSKLPEGSVVNTPVETEVEPEYDIDVFTGKTYLIGKKPSSGVSQTGKTVSNGNTVVRKAGQAIIDGNRTASASPVPSSMNVTRAANSASSAKMTADASSRVTTKPTMQAGLGRNTSANTGAALAVSQIG